MEGISMDGFYLIFLSCMVCFWGDNQWVTCISFRGGYYGKNVAILIVWVVY